jgi:hypothetical protein
MPVQINETEDAHGPFLAGTVLGYGSAQGDYIRIMSKEQAEAMIIALSRVIEEWADA